MKKIWSLVLFLVLLINTFVVLPMTANAQQVDLADTGATLYWPVYGHTSLSRGVGNGHNGLDITDDSINGASVRAAIGGTVTSIWLCGENHYGTANPMPSCCSGNGHGLVIRGDDGRYYNYAHMQAGSIPTDSVHYGARVEAGQMIGRVGSTGNSSGPHLHFQISTSSSWWLYGIVNPQNETYNYSSNAKSGLDIGDDFYALILNGPAWKPIGQTDSGNVEIMTESKNNYNRTLWHFVKRNSNNTYRIYSVLNGKCLDVYNASSDEGANVQCWDANDSQAQYWYYQVKGDAGALTAGCTNMYLDMNGGNSNDGTNIQMWSWNGTNAQKFSFYKVAEGSGADFSYSITADSTKMEAGESTDITIGDCQYAYNYKFHIIDSNGKETTVDNACNSVYHFEPADEGKYIIFAEVKTPYKTKIGSKDNLSVTITVGCDHQYTEQFVEAKADGEQGYILHTCLKCGKTYQDNYMDYKDGWYYPADDSAKLPDLIKNDDTYTVQYDNYYEKTQKDSPGNDWINAGVVKNEWQNKGGQYDSYTALPTSDSRVLVKECYYHFCIPGGAMGSEGNYEQTDTFAHYDEIALPNPHISVKWTGDDNGHTVYVLQWTGGAEVYCKSGEQCDGSWGYHDYRCRAWYKKYVYQDREKIELYKWTKDSGWIETADAAATQTACRFRVPAKAYLGDADGDGEITAIDVTYVQRDNAMMDTGIDEKVLMNADVDGNGLLEILDATWIQRWLAYMDINFAIGEAV